MGLRFRKSISLGKGIRLNVGKTGVSVSAGIPGFRKTIHSSGRVTTTVGVPGSGLYYVDTDHIGKKKRQQTKSQGYTTQTPVYQSAPVQPNTPIGSTRTPAGSFSHIRNESANTNQITLDQTTMHPAYIPPVVSHSEIVTLETPAIQEPIRQPSFRELLENCDLPISWIDVLSNHEPLDDNYDANTWDYLHSKALSVFEGDAEVMLRIIDEVSPFDDLNMYASDFSVEMEDSAELGIEFTVTKDIAPSDEMQDAVCSIVIRVARDAFAILPIERVTIHTIDAWSGTTTTWADFADKYNIPAGAEVAFFAIQNEAKADDVCIVGVYEAAGVVKRIADKSTTVKFGDMTWNLADLYF